MAFNLQVSPRDHNGWPAAVTLRLICLLVALAGATFSPPLTAQGSQPSARLIATTIMQFPGASDSNAPVLWETLAGLPRLFVLTSVSGKPTRHVGPGLMQLVRDGPVSFVAHPGHGVWFEAIMRDVDHTWYGFYHQERPAEVCGENIRTIPRIGAARSTDYGATWEDLGIVIEAPPGSYDCASKNRYFVGGVGDFSVALDKDAQYLYFFFSQYPSREQVQGVAMARMAWADRDAPAGRVGIWLRHQAWLPPRTMRTADERVRFTYPPGTPIYPAADGWHDDSQVDAFWGPSVHYNTYLDKYVMLLNRAKDSNWTQEGIYIAFSDRLDDPGGWSAPQRLLSSGRWYPQVVGLEPGTGTDKLAGQRARFFMSGRSEYLIEFLK